MSEKKNFKSDSFVLRKAKFSKETGVRVSYEETIEHEGSLCKVGHEVDSTLPRHPDLNNSLLPLKLHVARILGFDLGKKQGEETVTQRIEITGVSFKGDEGAATEGCVISFNLSVLDGKRVAAGQNTPFLTFDDTDIYPYAGELGDAVDNVRSEVKKYILHGKSAQLSLFDAVEEKAPVAKATKAGGKNKGKEEKQEVVTADAELQKVA
jgi:hypothetical protein